MMEVLLILLAYTLLIIVLTKVHPSAFFAWFDFWVGFYYDQKKRTLYINPLPCCVFKIAKQLIWVDMPHGVPFCPNCDRQLEESEVKRIKYSYPSGDVRWGVKARCKICRKKFLYRQSY